MGDKFRSFSRYFESEWSKKDPVITLYRPPLKIKKVDERNVQVTFRILFLCKMVWLLKYLLKKICFISSY